MLKFFKYLVLAIPMLISVPSWGQQPTDATLHTTIINEYPWLKVASEGEPFAIDGGSGTLRYGAQNNWNEVPIVAGTFVCSSATMGGDSNVGVVKGCYITTTRTTPPVPNCLPKTLGGTGTPFKILRTSAGDIGFFYCPGKFAPTLVTMTCAKEFSCLPDLPKFFSDLAASGPTSAFNNAWNANVRYPYADALKSTEIMNEVRTDIEVARLPNPVYVVAVNGTLPTRPVYPFTRLPGGAVVGDDNGTRTGGAAAKAAGSIQVGTTCDCLAGRTMVGTTPYCVAPGNTAKPLTGTLFVASCALKK